MSVKSKRTLTGITLSIKNGLVFSWLIYWLNVTIFLQYVPSNTLGNALDQKCIRKGSSSLNAVKLSNRAVKSAPSKILARSYIQGYH